MLHVLYTVLPIWVKPSDLRGFFFGMARSEIPAVFAAFHFFPALLKGEGKPPTKLGSKLQLRRTRHNVDISWTYGS